MNQMSNSDAKDKTKRALQILTAVHSRICFSCLPLHRPRCLCRLRLLLLTSSYSLLLLLLLKIKIYCHDAIRCFRCDRVTCESAAYAYTHARTHRPLLVLCPNSTTVSIPYQCHIVNHLASLFNRKSTLT